MIYDEEILKKSETHQKLTFRWGVSIFLWAGFCGWVCTYQPCIPRRNIPVTGQDAHGLRVAFPQRPTVPNLAESIIPT